MDGAASPPKNKATEKKTRGAIQSVVGHSQEYSVTLLQGVVVESVAPHDSFSPTTESQVTMRRLEIVNYEFIPFDSSLL